MGYFHLLLTLTVILGCYSQSDHASINYNIRISSHGLKEDTNTIPEFVLIQSQLARQLNTNSQCVECPPGTFSEKCSDDCDSGFCLRKEQCEPCPSGSYNPIPKQDKCLVCTPGFYCQGVNRTDMDLCPTGYHCPSRGLDLPILCPVQAHCPTEGLVDPLPCPQGYYCPEKGTINPEKCPAEHYCPERSDSPKRCGILRTSHAGAAYCSLSPEFYVILAVSMSCIAFVVVLIVFKVKGKKTIVTKPEETLPLNIPEPEGPQYSGL